MAEPRQRKTVSPSKIASAPKPRDPDNLPVTFVNHVVGLSVRNGIVYLTLSVIRPSHTAGTKDENVVVTRLCMPARTLSAVVEAEKQLRAAVQLRTAPTGSTN